MRLIFLGIFFSSLVLGAIAIELSRREKLDRSSFFIMVSVSIGLAVFSIMPELLRLASTLLGFKYTYVFTSTIGILGLLFLNIYTLAKISRTERRLNNLSQELALEN